MGTQCIVTRNIKELRKIDSRFHGNDRFKKSINKNSNNRMEAKLMSVKIKLRREGGKKKPFYKVVVIDSRKACNAKFIEQLGYYQPLSEPYVFKIDQEASLKWIGKGAQLSATVKDLFKKEGILKDR